MEADRRNLEDRHPDHALSGAQGLRDDVTPSTIRAFGADVPRLAPGLRAALDVRPESAGFAPSPYLWRIAF